MKPTPKHANDPLSDLEEAIDSLETTWGTVVAPAIEALRDVDPNDPDAAKILDWTAKLTWAIAFVTGHGKRVFGTEAGHWLNGELRARVRAVEKRAERDGKRLGVTAGYERGFTDCLTHEDTRPGTPSPERAIATVRARGKGGRLAEAWERALW